jgi:hypothetical protein
MVHRDAIPVGRFWDFGGSARKLDRGRYDLAFLDDRASSRRRRRRAVAQQAP